jgi:hypothetical protein
MWLVAGFVAVVFAVLLLGGKATGGKAAPRLRVGWTCGVVGLRGHGKSLFVMRLVAARIKAGQLVTANFSLDPVSIGGRTDQVRRALDWSDFMLAPEGSTVVIDEAHQWMPAIAGKTLDPRANWYVSHSRKLGHEVWWVAQHEDQVAGAVRKQTNEYVECKRYPFGRHRACAYAPHQFRKAKVRPLWAWWFQPKGAASSVYDTYELVRPDSKNDPDGSINAVIDAIYLRRGLDLGGDPSAAGPVDPASVNVL